MCYSNFDVEDFASDNYFRQWVLAPDPGTAVFWESWMRDNPGKSETVRKARHLLLAVQADTAFIPDAAVERLWEDIAARTIDHGETAVSSSTPNRRLSPWYYRLAASLLLLLTVGGVLHHYLPRHPDPITYRSRFGEIKEVRLPDGSTVVLNANSSLSFNPDWQAEGVREVNLAGEAYFTVQKRNLVTNGKVQPVKFVVNTPDLRVEVLGTRFNVTSRRNKTDVVLQSGKVRLALHDALAERVLDLKPGDLVSYSHRQKALVKAVVNPGQYHTWKEKRWTFRAASLADVALRIEDTFGLPVHWANDSLKRRTVSGVVPTDRLDVVLQALSVTMDLKITQDRGRIFIGE